MSLPVPSPDDVPDAATSDAAAPEDAPSPEDHAPRHDDITPERQRIFLEVLAATGSVAEAARQAAALRQAFYAHRTRENGEDFAEAWGCALHSATQLLCDAAYERAIHHVEEAVFYHGEQIGTRRRHNDRLFATLLRVRAEGFAPFPDLRGWRTVPSEPEPSFAALLAALGQPAPAPPPPPRRRRTRRSRACVFLSSLSTSSSDAPGRRRPARAPVPAPPSVPPPTMPPGVPPMPRPTPLSSPTPLPSPTPPPVDPRDHIPLTATTTIVPGDARWAAWSAGFDAARAAAVGPPCPAEVARAQRLAAQERVLFGAVRTRGLLRGALE